MATLQDIRRRIRSVQSTQKITRAMKLVAAAKLRRAQERILEARPYAFKMAELVGTLVRGLGEDKHPLLVRREGPRKLYVVVTADKGLCGAFNSNVIRRALELLRGSAEGTAVAPDRGAEGAGLLPAPPVAASRRAARVPRPADVRRRAGAGGRADPGVPR